MDGLIDPAAVSHLVGVGAMWLVRVALAVVVVVVLSVSVWFAKFWRTGR